MTAGSQDKKIKSADRVLEIFEMFSWRRQSLTVMEVARALDVPQSSTSELLSNLARRGYLTRERGARAFRPTARIALLGAWVYPTLFREGRLLPMIDRLHGLTGLGVSLYSMSGVALQHLHSVGEAREPEVANEDPHLLHSPFGQVLLSTRNAEDVRKIVHRLNAESEADQHVRYRDLFVILDQIGRKGYRMAEVEPGWSALVVMLPQTMGEEQMVLGVVGSTEEIQSRVDELVRCLRQAITSALGPRLAAEREGERLARAQ